MFTPFLYLYSITDTTKKLQDMTKVTKKLEEIKEYRNTRNVSTDNEFMIAIITNLLKISGITSENGRNDVKRLNIRVVTMSNDDKPKNRETQRKADLRRRMVCKSLPVKE